MAQTSSTQDLDILLLTKLKEKNPAFTFSPAQTKAMKKKLDFEIAQEQVTFIMLFFNR